jgi:glycosyltransferase involved in cell wall biosynthesis
MSHNEKRTADCEGSLHTVGLSQIATMNHVNEMRQSEPTAIAVYVPYQNPSALTVWCLEPLNGDPLIRHLVRRLERGFATLGKQHIYLLYPDLTVFAHEITKTLQDLDVELCKYTGAGTFAALRTFCSLHCEVGSVLLYPATSLFPDLELAQEMLTSHLAAGADVTVAQAYPPGLLPQIFKTAAVNKVPDLPTAIELEGDALELLKLMKSMGAQEETEDWRVSILNWAGPQRKHPSPEELPARLLMQGADMLHSAEKVLFDMSGSNNQDSSEALALKRELLSLNRDGRQRRKRDARVAAPPFRILYYSLASAFTGAEKIWLDLITHIDTSRYTPVVVLPFRSTLSERLDRAGIPVKISHFDLSAVTPHTMAFLDELFDSGPFALVHVNGIGGLPIVLKARYANIPVVFHAHNSSMDHLVASLEFADMIISVSNALERAIRRWEIPAENIKVIHNGIDLRAFSPGSYSRSKIRSEMGLDPDTRIILMVSRIEQSKRIDLMISALPTILQEHPNTQLFIAGEVYQTCFGYFERVRNLVTQLGLERQVHFLNFVEDLRELYAIAAVLVLCRDDEPLATCIIEALAMGVPVVAPNSWGCPELVTDGKEGFLFEPGDRAGLEKGILRLCDDPALHSEMSKFAKERASHFDLHTFVRRVQDVFDDLISSSTSCTRSIENSRRELA